MDTYGDNINPFDSGNNVYNADAKTVYGSLGYTVASVELGALYGQTTYGTNDDFKEKELNLTAGYPITESLATSLLLADIDGEESFLWSKTNGVFANFIAWTGQYEENRNKLIDSKENQ